MPSKKSIAVIGQGYVGLPLSLTAARAGWTVLGLDISKNLVDRLNRGISHIEDVSDADLQTAILNSNYKATTDPSLIGDTEIAVICVPTPLDQSGMPDLSLVKASVERISPHLKPDSTIINESTSYPGTLRDVIKPLVEISRSDRAKSIKFASAPERVDPTNSNWNLRTTPRLVSGLSKEATSHAFEFYSSFCESVIKVSSPEVAESAKLLENTFRQVNIALLNQLVPVYRSMGIDVHEVVEAASTKPYGFMRFSPGAGVGGHCIPIDPMYLLWKAREIGLDLPLIEVSNRVNREMPHYVARRLIQLADLKVGDTALILGVAYKSGISDVRETPASEVATYLNSEGISVFWNDPLVSNFGIGQKWTLGMEVKGAIVVTSQPGLPVRELVDDGIPILDCTGAYRAVAGVSQL